jgi:putative membrane protein
MPKKVILAIDRDNDLGRKAGIEGVVIGREENIRAAIKLAESDPEDSDINTIFAAIKIYDELLNQGENVEVVTITGDMRVGVVSDSKIAEHLDYIATKVNPESVIVVTDGSEDEFVLPIISSRFKIDSVRRIIVKQSKTIEGTYYLIRKLLSDPKIAKTFFVPIGIILIIYSVFVFANYPQYAVGSIIFLVGLYLILRAYDLDVGIEAFFSNVKTALVEGRISFVTYIISAILIIIGLIEGFYTFWRFSNQPVSPGVITLATSFIYGAIWYFTSAGIFIAVGKLLDAIIEHKSFLKYITICFLLISAGLALWGGSLYILSNYEPFQMESGDAVRYFALSLFGAVFIAIVGMMPMRLKGRLESSE